LKNIAIYGAGGLGREVAWMLKEINLQQPSWEIIGFFDDGKKKNEIVDDLPVLGGLPEANEASDLHVALAIADPAIKRKLVSDLKNPHIDFPILVHPSTYPGDYKTNRFGKGTILTAGVILTTGITLGEFVFVNLATTIGHDVTVGNYSTIMPSCSISGNVIVGEACLVGVGARILQQITIGNNSLIGAGSVVTKTFDEGSKVVGVPARKHP
jgi:sugar O-acyltransferase (sialic acid O-acetyltransferase NeuD family)